MENKTKAHLAHKFIKEKVDTISNNKENIPNVKHGKPKSDLVKTTFSDRCNIKRFPLTDIINDPKNIHVPKKHENIRNQITDTKNKCKEIHPVLKGINNGITSKENNKIQHSTRPNLPKLLVRSQEEKLHPSDSIQSTSDFIDTKFITFSRNFDFLNRDDDLIEKLENNNDSLGFNEIDNSSIVKVDTAHATPIDELCCVFNFPIHMKIDGTPVNTWIPHPSNDIKQIRKNITRQISIEKDAQSRIFVHGKQRDELLSAVNTNPSTKLSFGGILSPLIPFPITCEENKEKRKVFNTSYRIPGAVHLDNKENYVFHNVLFSTTYLDFIMKHQLTKEYKHQLSDNFLKKFDITDLNRSIVINWLIKLQTYMRTEHVLVYTAIRIMDRTIDSLEIPLNMLQLVALASYWISLKFHAVDHKNISWMVKQSGGAYSSKELADMERKVLQANHFDINTIDSSIYIHFYVLKLELSNADIVAHCAHYLLDCALLDSCFVRTLPSMMAAAVVFTSLYLLKQYSEKNWTKLCIHCGYYPPEELLPVRKNIIEVLKEVNNPTFQCRQPYYKYCSSRYFGIADIVLDAILVNDF